MSDQVVDVKTLEALANRAQQVTVEAHLEEVDMTRLVGIGLRLSFDYRGATHRRPRKTRDQMAHHIEWVSFTDGQSNAALTGKPMLVLVYAHWCTQCVRLSVDAQ